MAKLTTEQLTQELFRRALITSSGITREFCESLANLILRYDLKLTMDSFTSDGVVLTDADGRSVGVYQSVVQNGYMRSDKEPYTDIIIIESSGIFLGWLQADRVQVSDGGFAVGVKSLMKIPNDVFQFAQPCPHLSEYGGMWLEDETAWECFGCGKTIPELV